MGREGSSSEDMMLMKAVRASLWKLLRGMTLKGGQFNDGYKRPGGTPCNGPYGEAPPDRAKMTLVHARPLLGIGKISSSYM